MHEMKDSGVEWVGKVPATWKIMPNKYIMTKKKVIKEVYDDENIISLSMNGVIVRDLEAGGKMPKTFDGYQLVYPGNLLMCLFDYDVTPRCIGLIKDYGVTSPAYSQFVMNNGNYSGYYYYYYLMVDHTKALLHLAKNLRHSFTEEQLGAILAPVPTIEEQQQIADYLDTKCSEIDATAEDIQKEISLLEDYKKSVITEAVTKGLNPDAEMKDSGIAWIGEIPKGWKVIRLKYITNSIGDGLHGTPNYDDLGTISFINGNNWGNRKISITEKTNRLTEEEYKKYGVLKLDKRTLLMSLNGTYGTLSMYDNEPIMLSKSVGYINVCNKETKEYLYYFLQSSLAQNQMTISLAGTTIANLSLATVRNLRICLPSICEQQQITDFLDTKCSEIDAIIADKKRQLDILADYKKSLIYEYVTGKKEVPVHE